jgi:hypothetical protein
MFPGLGTGIVGVRARLSCVGRGVLAAILALGLGTAVAEPAAGSVDSPPDRAGVQLLANCFDACTVTVVLSGNGSGSFVTTNSSGVPNGLISCVWLNGAQAPGSDCTETYCCIDRASPVTVYFKLTPSTGSKACYGVSPCISGTVSGSRTLPSTNEPVQTVINGYFYLATYAVDVAAGGTGYGYVGSSPTGILCPQGCQYSFDYGTQLTLTASPNEDSYFDHWTGACAGQDATCSLTVTGPVTTTFFLTLGSPPTASPPAPTPTATAAATPRVTAKPTGTPTPGKTARPTTGATTAPAPSSEPGSADPGSPDPGASLPVATPDASDGLTAPASTQGPAAPAVATGSDLTPIALAILGAGLLIAIGIGAAAFALRKRPAPPA